MNILWLNLTATTHSAADLATVLDGLVTAYATRFAGFIPTGFNTEEAKVSWLYASGQSLEVDHVYTHAGSAGTPVDYMGASKVINWHIADFYRGGKPRTYLPGVAVPESSDGRTVVAGTRSALATAAVNFMNDVNALTAGGISAVTLGTVRFESGNAWLSPPVFRAYTGATVRSVLGTQRRRLGK